MGAEFLEFQPDAHGVALGGAYSAVGEGVSSLWWNPAGLSRLSRPETSVSYMRYPGRAAFDYTFIAAGIPIIKDKLVAGGYVGYLDMAHLNVTTVTQPDGTGEVYKPYDYQAAASVAYRLIKNLSSRDER